MISYLEAINILHEIAALSPRYEDERNITDAIGLVLSRDVVGYIDVPHFDNSAMDGFALRSSDTLGASADSPIKFQVSSFVAAGDVPCIEDTYKPFVAGTGQDRAVHKMAIEIMTGAKLPADGVDAVVRVEDVEKLQSASGAQEIILRKPVRPFENIRLRASDFRLGDVVAESGAVVGPEHLMAFASLGISRVWCHERPKIAILSTGKELVEVGAKLDNSAQIWNSSASFLISSLQTLGCEVTYLGIVRDEADEFERRIQKGIEDGMDILISTGAVSMGKYDFITESLKKLGAKIHFHKTSIRPGKPICFAELSSTQPTRDNDGRRERQKSIAFFGLPGNPISTAIGLRFFVEPFLRTRLSLQKEEAFAARLSADVKKPVGLKCFFKGCATLSSGGVQVLILERQASYVVSSLLEANCWVVLPEEGEQLHAGTQVQIYPINPSFSKGVFQ